MTAAGGELVVEGVGQPREYRVEVETDIALPTDDDELDDIADRLIDALEPVSGVVGGPRGTLSVTVSVDAADTATAVKDAMDAVLVALRAIGRSAGTLSLVAGPPND